MESQLFHQDENPRGHVWNLELIFINKGGLAHSFVLDAHSFMLATKSSPFLMEPLSSARASDTSFSSNAESLPRPRFFSIPFFWNKQKKEFNYISPSLPWGSGVCVCVHVCVIPQAAEVWRSIYTLSPLIAQTHTPPLPLSRSWRQGERTWSELQRKPLTEWQNLKHTQKPYEPFGIIGLLPCPSQSCRILMNNSETVAARNNRERTEAAPSYDI